MVLTHEEKTNRTQCPENTHTNIHMYIFINIWVIHTNIYINLCAYIIHLICDTGDIVMQWEKNSPFKKWWWISYIHVEKIFLDSTWHNTQESISEGYWSKYKINNETCRKSIGEHHHDFIVSKDFLSKTYKV